MIFEIVNDIAKMVDIVSHLGYIPNKSGFINCPFHHEKTPSLKIYKNSYHCFGCNAHGDSIDFVAQDLNMSLLDSAKYIANIYGIETSQKSIKEKRRLDLRNRDRDEVNKSKVIKQEWYNILAYFHRELWQNRDNWDWEDIEEFAKIQIYINWLDSHFKSFYLFKKKEMEGYKCILGKY